ncbi:MAG: hypothetical protein PWP60_761 [Candidatus Atribacteria bacterium]|nr:hypothetical protein [Candidatus Atribacteria bacterium]
MLSRRDYIRNFVVDSLDYSFFALALTLGSITTFLPLFARRLGASNFQVGLIPAIAYLGWSVPALWGGRYSSKLDLKLPFVLKFTFLERLPFLGLSLVAFWLVPGSNSLALLLTYLLLGVACFAMGFLGPIWIEMIGKVIHPRRRGLYFALGNGIGALMGIWGSRIAEDFLKRYPFATNFGYCFGLAFLALLVSYLFLALTREEKEVAHRPDTSIWSSIPRILKVDRNFTNFLIARIFLALGMMGSSFYTVFTLSAFQVSDATVARYNAFLMGAQALSNFLWGPLGDRMGHKLVLILGAVLVVLSNLIALISSSYADFFLTFALFGAYYSALSVAGVAILLDFAPSQGRGDYLGIGSFVAGFPSFLAPLLGGKLADLVGYRALFLYSFLVNLAGFLWLFFGVKEPRAFREGE